MNTLKEVFEFHGKQMETLYNLVRGTRKLTIKDESEGEQKVAINRAKAEHDCGHRFGDGCVCDITNNFSD